MAARNAALPASLVAAVLALCSAAVLAPAAAAPGAHERACGAAFGVLRHCAAAGGNREDVRARCCGLLEAFQHNGCLCPDCPPGASADATSAKGLLLGAELSPLADLCGSTALSGPSNTQQQQAEEEDADDMMADMAGLAAGAQDPARAQRLARNSAAAAAAAARAAEERLEQSSDDSPLLDTPEDDYDNLLSDADAAFMLVDPAVARSYASRAAQLARSVAADAAARVAAGRAAAAELESELYARLEALLARGGTSLPAGSTVQRQQAQEGAAGVEEDVASASAVADDSAATALPGGGRGSPAVLLARADAVPQTAEQRRAAALAAALERQQERNLQRKQQQQQQLVHTAELRQQRRNVEVAVGGVQQQQVQEGEDAPVRKLSLDITIDADNPEAARRMVGSIAAVLKSFQAAGSAHSQEELAAVLESTAAKVAAASSSLGRAGLQPRQLLLEQVEEEGEGPRSSMCACMDVELPAVDGPAPDLAATAYRRYLEARVALCRFACQHQQKLAILLVVEVALCVLWLAIWMVRSGQAAAEAEGAPDCHPLYYVQHQHGQPEQQQQFLIATAADPQWQGELKQPLLGREDSADSSSSRS